MEISEKKAFRVISNDGDYEGFFLMGTQYKFDYEKGYGFTDEVITGTEEYNGKPLVMWIKLDVFRRERLV